MLLTLGVAGGGLANAQDEDLCFALTTEEIAAAIPGTYDAPAGFPDSCQWHGTSSGGDPVDMVLYAAPGSADDLSTGDTVATTIGGFQGFTASDTTRDPPAGIAAADLGGTVVTLSLSGPSVDPAVVASGLAEIAVGRIAERASGVPAGDDGSGTEPGAGTHGDPCSLFTTDEIAGLMALRYAPSRTSNPVAGIRPTAAGR